jgi:transcription termination factor NusB
VRSLQNIRQRNGIFIFRRKVPRRLQPLIKRSEILLSLGRCDPRRARLQATRLWTITEQLFQMMIEYRTTEEDAELLAPAQVKQFVDTMLAHARFNDEYAASVYDSDEIRRLNPVDRQILGHNQ